MPTTIVNVDLEKIYSSPTQPRKYFNQARLNELAESIKIHEIIQAILLRENPKGSGKYETVFGERRVRASRLAERKTIPANIRVLSDDEVQELQFIENLERVDLHAMDEAVTFKAMRENSIRPWQIEDIAAKINKPVSYVVQRLQLNKLIPALQKDFWDEKFYIGHAMLFARLTDADQKNCIKKYYGTVKEVEAYIEQNVIQQLSSAPFKMNDDTLVVKCGAGPCTTCLKRSGANTLLFPDIKQEDRCFDRNCFAEKKEAWLIREVKDILETRPEILLIDYGHPGSKVPPDITTLSKQYKHRILNFSANEVQQHQGHNYHPFKALWVSGNDAGSYKTVYRKLAVQVAKAAITAKAAAGEKITPDDIDLQIGAINERQARALEIDAENIWDKISEKIKDPSFFDLKLTFNSTDTLQEERNAMAYALLSSMKGEYYKAGALVLKLEYSQLNDISMTGTIVNVTDHQIFHLLRLFTISSLKEGYSHVMSAGPLMLMPLLKKYAPKTIAEIEEEQNEIAADRIKRAKNKIEILEGVKNELKPKKDPAAAKVRKAIQGKLRNLIPKTTEPGKTQMA